MQHTVYFLIEPNAAATREFPLRTQSEISQILLEPLLTSRTFADRSPWRDKEAELAVKLLYVARMREYEPLAHDSHARQALGSGNVSVQLFDQWWTIRRLRMEEGRSEEMHDFLLPLVQKVEATGNTVVDEWINMLREAT